MINNEKIIDRLLTTLKQERSIINLSQTVETISILILIRYFEIKLKKNRSDEFFYYDTQDLGRYIRYCKELLNDAAPLYQDMINRDDIHKLLFAPLENTFFKMDAHTVFNEINSILSEIRQEANFFILLEDYRALIDTMVLESTQTGLFYTPKALCELLVKTLKPQCGDHIYDPVCGSGGVLLEAYNSIHRNENSLCEHSQLVGTDISSFPAIISLVSFILSGSKAFHLNLADSLNQKTHDNTYDIVLANPPFGPSEKIYDNEKYRERTTYKEYLFLKHIMDSLKKGGQAAVILPDRFLSDESKACRQLKNELFHAFNVQAILSVPPGAMLPYTGVKITILFFSKTPPAEEIWVYQLNSVERFTRKDRVTLEIFDDFIHKYKHKTISQNSWRVRRDALGEEYNLFQRKNDFEYFNNLDVPQKYLSQCHTYQKELATSLDKITQKIETISKQINTQFNHYKFSSFKLSELISSKSSKALAKEQLQENGEYPVYGGNGIIGYYNEYTHSGNFIIIGRVGAYCGNVRYVQGKIWATNNAIILKCTALNIAHPPYLAKILAKKELRQLASGTAQAHLTMNKINDVEVYLPPLSVQIELDQWLSELEHELTTQQTLIEAMTKATEAMNNALYQHLLHLEKK